MVYKPLQKEGNGSKPLIAYFALGKLPGTSEVPGTLFPCINAFDPLPHLRPALDNGATADPLETGTDNRVARFAVTTGAAVEDSSGARVPNLRETADVRCGARPVDRGVCNSKNNAPVHWTGAQRAHAHFRHTRAPVLWHRRDQGLASRTHNTRPL